MTLKSKISRVNFYREKEGDPDLTAALEAYFIPNQVQIRFNTNYPTADELREIADKMDELFPDANK